MSIWVRKTKLGWPWGYRVWCTRCRFERVGLRATQAAGQKKAIQIEAEHYVQCPGRGTVPPKRRAGGCE